MERWDGTVELPRRSSTRVRRSDGTPDRRAAQREPSSRGDSSDRRGDPMTWRDHTWEFAISALSWLIAIGALVFVASFVAFEAFKNRRRSRR